MDLEEEQKKKMLESLNGQLLVATERVYELVKQIKQLKGEEL